VSKIAIWFDFAQTPVIPQISERSYWFWKRTWENSTIYSSVPTSCRKSFLPGPVRLMPLITQNINTPLTSSNHG